MRRFSLIHADVSDAQRGGNLVQFEGKSPTLIGNHAPVGSVDLDGCRREPVTTARVGDLATDRATSLSPSYSTIAPRSVGQHDSLYVVEHVVHDTATESTYAQGGQVSSDCLVPPDNARAADHQNTPGRRHGNAVGDLKSANVFFETRRVWPLGSRVSLSLLDACFCGGSLRL